MSHRRAKKIRHLLCPSGPELGVPGVSRGSFTRMLTRYDRKVHKRVLCPWPLQELFGPIPVDYYTQTLDKECPRAYNQKFKRYRK